MVLGIPYCNLLITSCSDRSAGKGVTIVELLGMLGTFDEFLYSIRSSSIRVADKTMKMSFEWLRN